MKRHRLFSKGLVLCLVLITALLSACGGGTAQQPTKAGTGAPLEFSFYSNYDWMTYKPWGQDDVSKWIQENKKVSIKFVNSNGAAKQKLNQMLASNSLADTIQLERGPDVDRLVNAKKLVALDPYLEKYPNFKKMIGEDTLNLLRSKDGKLYQIPNWYIGEGGATGQYWTILNKKIHTELGSPKVETMSELESYLRLVKSRYPDVVPMDMVNAAILYPAFSEERSLQNLNMLGYKSGNSLKSIYQDPVFKESMQFTNKLFRDKLISQDLFTHTTEQVKEKLNTGKLAVYIGWDGSDIVPPALAKLKDTFTEPVYQAVWPFYKDGLKKENVKPGSFNKLGWNVNVVTTKAQDPEAIIAYFDWLLSEEGQRTVSFGPKGLFWDELDSEGNPIPNERYKTVDKNTLESYGILKYNFMGNTNLVDSAKMIRDSHLPVELRDWSTIAQQEVVYKASQDTTEFVNLAPNPTDAEGIIKQRLDDHYKQVLAKILFAPDDATFQSELTKADQESQNLGMQKFLEFETKKWQENLKILNQ